MGYETENDLFSVSHYLSDRADRGMRSQPLGQYSESSATVRHLQLFLPRDLGEGSAVRGIQEDRVVPEPFIAARLVRDFAFHGLSRFEDDPRAVDDCKSTDEPGGARPIRPATELAKDVRKAFLVRS